MNIANSLLDLPGDQHFLPYVAQLIMVDSNDSTLAFNLFALSGCFTFSNKIPGRCAGSTRSGPPRSPWSTPP